MSRVSDSDLAGRRLSAAAARRRAEVLQRLRLGDAAFRMLTRAAAIAVLVILGGVILSLVIGSLPALRDLRPRLPHRPRSGTRSPNSSARWRRSTARSSPRSSPC